MLREYKEEMTQRERVVREGHIEREENEETDNAQGDAESGKQTEKEEKKEVGECD